MAPEMTRERERVRPRPLNPDWVSAIRRMPMADALRQHHGRVVVGGGGMGGDRVTAAMERVPGHSGSARLSAMIGDAVSASAW